MMDILEVRGLSKSFGDLTVLKSVDLSVREGERIAIIGASGCGKSVFLRCLNLLEQPDAGSVIVNGMEITAQGADVDKIRRQMGMVFQKFCLFSHRNVMDNLCLAPTKLLGMKREEAEEKAMELLREVGLVAKAKAFPQVLSGGQQQRIAICRALMMEPKILFMDEPTSALDPTMVGEVLAVIRMLAKQGRTMLIVTHEMDFAREVADRILFFAEGGIYEQGTPEEIFDRPKREKTISFIQKHKYFTYEIRSKTGFDLMELQGGIWSFAEKYGITVSRIYALQHCAEELIYEFFDNVFKDTDDVHIALTLTYAESRDIISLELQCGGAAYNPFLAEMEADEESDEHIGITILKKKVKHFSYGFKEGVNRVTIEL